MISEERQLAPRYLRHHIDPQKAFPGSVGMQPTAEKYHPPDGL
jgi:hypothetical protein